MEVRHLPILPFLNTINFLPLSADDEEQITAHFVQVDIWSTGNYNSLVDQVKARMKDNGFRRTSEADLYEADTEIFHKALRFRLN
jgi:hypothetical protein